MGEAGASQEASGRLCVTIWVGAWGKVGWVEGWGGLHGGREGALAESLHGPCCWRQLTLYPSAAPLGAPTLAPQRHALLRVWRRRARSPRRASASAGGAALCQSPACSPSVAARGERGGKRGGALQGGGAFREPGGTGPGNWWSKARASAPPLSRRRGSVSCVGVGGWAKPSQPPSRPRAACCAHGRPPAPQHKVLCTGP